MYYFGENSLFLVRGDSLKKKGDKKDFKGEKGFPGGRWTREDAIFSCKGKLWRSKQILERKAE